MDWKSAFVPVVTLGALLSLAGRGGLPVGPEVRLQEPATVSGRVTEADGGAPVADAAIEVVGAGALQTVRTGADGRFTLRVIWDRGEESTPGSAVLRTHVGAAGYQALELELKLAPGTHQQDFQLAPSAR